MGKGLRITFVVLALLVAMVAGAVYADVSVTSATLGSDNQERGVTVSDTFTIKNNFNESITINAITNSADSKYSLNATGIVLPKVLATGASVSVTLNGFVSLDHDAVDDDLDEVAINIGSISVDYTKGGSPASSGASVTMQAENKLTFKDADIEISGDETDKTSSIDDGDEYDIDPGDDIQITTEVENEFSDSKDEDFEFDTVKVKVEIDDDGDFDIDDDSDSFSLDAEDEETSIFDITVEDDAEDTNHNAELSVAGTDENGAKHGELIKFDLNVEREKNDVRIKRFEVSPTRLTCSANSRFLDVEVRIQNRGTKNQDEAAIEVAAPTIGFRDKVADIEIDEDDESTRNFLITVPEDAPTGPLKVTATSFFSDSISSDRDEVIVIVDECDVDEPVDADPVVVPTNPTVPTVPTGPTVITQPTQGSSGVVSATPTSGGSFRDSTGYLVLLVGVVVLGVVAVLVLLGAVMMRKK
jgi:hypothetical protein